MMIMTMMTDAFLSSSSSSFSLFIVSNNNKHAELTATTGRRHPQRLLGVRGASGYINNDNTENDDGSIRNTVGDYVKNVHGGKYQFEEHGGGGMNSVGQQFAESLYSSSSSSLSYDTDDVDDNDDDKDISEWPRWAQNMGMASESSPNIRDTLVLNSSTPSVSVQVTNQERTWEEFYVKVIDGNNNNAMGDIIIEIEPVHGVLAPRGGANNVCDPNQPYSDSVTINVRLSNNANAEDGATDGTINNNDEFLLVIGTEEDKWYYEIKIQ